MKAFSPLAKWAEDEFRSVNGQIEMILDKALTDVGRKKNKNEVTKVKTNHSKVRSQ